jgi:hypothetical protein
MVRICLADSGETLELFPNARIVWKMRNPMLVENVLPLTYSLPFKLPMLGSRNAALLKYPFAPQRKAGIRPFEVLVYFSESRPRKGLLQIGEVTEQYAEANILIDKSIEDIGATKIRELLADIILAETAMPVHQQIDLQVVANPMFYPNYIAQGKLIAITINGQEFSTPATSNLNFNTANVMYMAINAIINSADLDITATVEGTDAATIRIRLYNNNPGTAQLFELDLQKYLDEYRDGEHAWYWKVYEETDWMEQHIAAVEAMVNSTNGQAFIFPPVRNARFDESEGYPGFQNAYYAFNVSLRASMVAHLTPFPKLANVLSELMKKLGYQVVNNYIFTGDFGKLYLYSNVSFDRQVLVYGPVAIGPAGALTSSTVSIALSISMQINSRWAEPCRI